MGDEKFLDHACNPRNVGLLEDANVVIQAGDSECDDKQIFFIRIEDDMVQDIRFLIEGCETTIATASIVTEMVTGQSLDTVLTLSDRSIAAAAGWSARGENALCRDGGISHAYCRTPVQEHNKRGGIIFGTYL